MSVQGGAGMKMMKLGGLVAPSGTRAGTTADFPVYSVTKYDGFVPSLEYFKKQVFSRNVESYKLVEPGDFAYATIHLDEGSIGIAPERALISPMYTVFRTDSSIVDPAYLIRFLKSPRALAQYARLGQGAIHRRKAISLKALGSLQVPLFGLEEQRRVAEILDRADEIRAKRRQQLAHLDTLTQSIFREMFGDIRRTRWETSPLGEVVSGIGTGISPKCEVRPALEDEWGVLKLSAVTQGVFKPTENKAYLGDVGPLRKNEVHEGDVLMTRKNTRELVGAVAIAQRPPARLLLPDLIFRLVVNSRQMDPQYFQSLMMSEGKRAQVRELSGGSAGSMPNISMARLKKLPIELPPLDIQRTFAERVEVIHVQRSAVERALAADDELFASLQSRAFRGEL